METAKNEFRRDLTAEDPKLLVSTWILERIPVIFNGDSVAYEKWRGTFASMIEVDPAEVKITGSAAFGVSLNPYKNFKLFDDSSDIDLAIVSEHFFSESWRELRHLGNKRHSLSPAAKQSVKDHVEKYIYWGTIATDKILHVLPFGKQWSSALQEMAEMKPTKNRSIKARIYKDFECLRSYHVANLKNLRTKELEEE
ncbi:MAG: hypothetical protein ACSHX8_09905 [Opitutaceae bacterium]